MLKQLVAEHQVDAGIGKGELAEVLVGKALAQGVGRIGQVLAAEHIREALAQQFRKRGDRLGAIDVQFLPGWEHPRGEQLLQDQQHGAVTRQAAAMDQRFAVVGAADAEGLSRHGVAADRFHNAVEGDQAQRLLHLGGPLGQRPLDVSLKRRKIGEHQLLDMGRQRGGDDPQRCWGGGGGW